MFESWIRYEVLAAEDRARRAHYRKLYHAVPSSVDSPASAGDAPRRWSFGDFVRSLMPAGKRTSRTG